MREVTHERRDRRCDERYQPREDWHQHRIRKQDLQVGKGGTGPHLASRIHHMQKDDERHTRVNTWIKALAREG